MQENTKDKEKYSFLRPTGIETFAFIFSAGALQWLHGTTPDDDGREIGNFTLFGDLLARMALADGTAKGFHRPLTLSVGQAQYSEEQLSRQWSMGRKRIRRLLDELARLELIRHLPFKGCVRDDIPVPVAVDGKGWQRSFQPVHPQTKGKDRTALNGGKRTDWLISHYSVVPLSGKPSGAHRAFQWLT